MQSYTVIAEGRGDLWEKIKTMSHRKMVSIRTTVGHRGGEEILGYLLGRSDGEVQVGVHTYKQTDGEWGSRNFVAQILKIPTKNIVSMQDRN